MNDRIDSTVQAAIFAWLTTNVLESQATVEGKRATFARIGGQILLQYGNRRSLEQQAEDIRYWTIDPIPEGKETEMAKEWSIQMEREAEAHCEGIGGGKQRYALRAQMNGQRRITATHAFWIEVDQGVLEPPPESPREIMRAQADMIRDYHRALLESQRHQSNMFGQMSGIIKEQAKALEMLPKQMVEMFTAMAIVNKNQIGQEAAAFETAQRARDMHDFFQDVKPYVPAVIQGLMARVAGADGGGNGNGGS